MELEIIDLESRELRSGASEVLPLLGRDHPNGEHPRAKHELLESTVEIITGICTTVEEARKDPAVPATSDSVRLLPRGAP